MIVAMVAATALAMGAVQQVDTTFAVRAGGTIEVESHGGSVVVGSWDRDAIRITTARAGGSQPRIRVSGSEVSVRAESRFGAPSSADYRITVPRSFGVQVEGLNVAVTVEGTTGDIEVENIEGMINIRDVTGSIDIESVSGGVSIENVRGSVSVATVNQNIRLAGVQGDIDVETTNGGITIRSVESARVRASTVNGFVEYDGTVRDGGSYYLGAHNGRVTMSLGERANASVTIATNSGRVDAAFPVQITSLRNRRTQFTLGTGSATVELESFNGTVHLVRPTGR